MKDVRLVNSVLLKNFPRTLSNVLEKILCTGGSIRCVVNRRTHDGLGVWRR